MGTATLFYRDIILLFCKCQYGNRFNMIVIDTLIRSYGVRSYLYMHPGNIAEDVGPGAKPHRARQGKATLTGWGGARLSTVWQQEKGAASVT